MRRSAAARVARASPRTADLKLHIMPRLKSIFATVLIAAYASVAGAGGLKALQDFVHEVKSGQARYTQVVTPPARDGQPARPKTSRGEMAFQRPDRLRFETQQPFAQTIVADGQTLWFYDPDLNQVSARPQKDALAHTPAALLASSADLAALQRDYVLSDAPERAGLQWVLATPRAADAPLRQLALGLRVTASGAATPELLEVEDAFGQRSQLRLEDFVRNPSLPAARFRFTPPAGADLLRP